MVVELEALQTSKSPHHQHVLRLRVDHIPVISLPDCWNKKSGTKKDSVNLAVDLAGVLITTDGIKWARPLLESSPVIWLQLYGISQDQHTLHASIALKRV